jgi:hypothetical protein
MVTAAIVVAAITVPAAPANAAGSMPVVDIAVASDGQATISQTTMRPGVVEFHVGKTATIPADLGGNDSLSIVRTDQLDLILQTLPAVFSADGSPETLAAAAQGMRQIHAISTWYGGTHEGGVWQVYLPAGNYYAMGATSTALGLAKPVAFTVSGQPRSAKVHSVQAAIWATGSVGQNQFRFAQLGKRSVTWFAFRNNAQEIHFLDINPVKPGTTTTQVNKAFSPASDGPPSWLTGPPYSFDVISPGVRVAVKHTIDPGKYVVDCFIPSETDGMPHALMGMYKLITVK